MLDAVLITANEIDDRMQNVFEFPRAILWRFKLPAPSYSHPAHLRLVAYLRDAELCTIVDLTDAEEKFGYMY